MTAVEWLVDKLDLNVFESDEEVADVINQAKEMEKEQKIEFAKMHVKIALKAVENEMILQASSVKHWYLPETIK
jgi:hypothetical protein